MGFARPRPGYIVKLPALVTHSTRPRQVTKLPLGVIGEHRGVCNRGMSWPRGRARWRTYRRPSYRFVGGALVVLTLIASPHPASRSAHDCRGMCLLCAALLLGRWLPAPPSGVGPSRLWCCAGWGFAIGVRFGPVAPFRPWCGAGVGTRDCCSWPWSVSRLWCCGPLELGLQGPALTGRCAVGRQSCDSPVKHEAGHKRERPLAERWCLMTMAVSGFEG